LPAEPPDLGTARGGTFLPLIKRIAVLVATGFLALGAAVLVQTKASADDASSPVDYDATLTEVAQPPSDALTLLTTPALSDTLQENFQQAVQDCVERTGFDYTVPEAMATPAASPLAPNEEAGYGVVVSHTPEAVDAAVAAEEEAREANLDYAGTLEQADSEVYLEVIGEVAPAEAPAPGEASNCKEAAVQTVLEPAMQAQMELADETLALAAAIERRPEVQAAAAEWSDCMQAAGHHYADPSQPEQDIVSVLNDSITTPDLDALLAKETTVAAADAGCRDATGYTAVVEKAAVAEWQAADINTETIEIAAGAVQ
jgi:hypothetical protein